MSNLKLVLVILTFGLLCFMGTAAAFPHHDWYSPHGICTPFWLVATGDLPLVHAFVLLQCL